MALLNKITTGIENAPNIIDSVSGVLNTTSKTAAETGILYMMGGVFMISMVAMLGLGIWTQYKNNSKARRLQEDQIDKQTRLNQILFDKFMHEYLKQNAEIKKQDEKVHKEAYNWRLSLTKPINDMLKELIVNTGADRAMVFEFKNGSYNITGLPMSRIDCTFEAVNPETHAKPHITSLQNVSTSVVSRFIAELIEKQEFCVCDIDTIKKENPATHAFLEDRGVFAVMASDINSNSEQLGFVVVEFEKNNPNIKPENKEKLCIAVDKVSERLGALLDYGKILNSKHNG